MGYLYSVIGLVICFLTDSYQWIMCVIISTNAVNANVLC